MYKISSFSGRLLIKPRRFSFGPFAFLTFSELKILFFEMSKIVVVSFLMSKSFMLNGVIRDKTEWKN